MSARDGIILFMGIGVFCLTLNASHLLPQESVWAPSRLGNVRLYCDGGKFAVWRNGKIHNVNSYDVHPTLRTVARNGMVDKFLKVGCILVGTIGEKGNLYYSLTAYAYTRW